ncbi:MAG TPA: autotransporter-associated beta strand repeat-containing protein, partial [Planctomycetota bacterium]|nr:autotransporter-associated beta strand repeat-containing protein [Planctomycetota bacterium]
MKHHNVLFGLSLAAMFSLSGFALHAASLDLNGAILTYTAGTGISNALTVSVTGSSLVFNDTAETITTGIANATGSGTNTVSIPFAGVTSLVLALGDGTDTITGSGVVVNGTSAALSITHNGAGLTIGGPISTDLTTGAGITITASGTGGVILNASLTTSNSNIAITSMNDLSINGNITAGSGTIALTANADGTGTESFTQAAFGSTISTTSTSGSAVLITVNTGAGGTGNASIRAIAATGGTLKISAFAGSILYSGTDALDVQQAAQTTLAAGILGPAGSASGLGGSGSAPSGTANAKTYNFSCNGSASIGTADRPIQTSSPASNTETLVAGSGGVYFVDWGNPLSLTTATATGAGNVVVVSANAGGHNLTVAGTVTTGSGNIVLCADDDFVVNAGVTVGGATFSGNVYMCGNRDTGNTGKLAMSGSVITSSTANPAIVLEDFHAKGNGTAAGNLTVNNLACGDGGTIVVSTVPTTLASGQGQINPVNASSLINAGPTGTVKLIATTVTGQGSIASSIGKNGSPISVTAGNVICNANSGPASNNVDSVFITNSIGSNFSGSTGSTAPSGDINYTVSSGAITINGSTSTGNNATINLTASGTGGGININAPLGNASTGALNLNAGNNPVVLNTFFAPLSTEAVTITSSNGLTVSSTGTLAGSWAAPNATTINVQSGGTFSPGDTGVATVPVGNIQLVAGSTLRMDINSAALFDSLNVTGTVDVTGSTLALFVNSPITQGTSFTLINNDGNDPITGQFVGGTTIAAINDARYVFTINYAGGDGNDVVATLSSNAVGTLLDVNNGIINYLSESNINNALSVTRSGGNYTFTDPSVSTLVLSPSAVSAGWSLVNSHTATGPVSGVTAINANFFDGTDAITGIDAGSAALTVQGTGSLTINGQISSTNTVTLKNVTDITSTVAGGTPTIKATTVTLNSTNSVGTSLKPVTTQATAIIANTGAGGVYLTEADGADVTANATGAGNIVVVNNTGTLNIAGATSTVTGNISLTSNDALTISANVNAGSGTITFIANADGAGAQGYDQKGAILTTTNTSGSALTINVNTAAGGSGDAVIGQANIGSTSGGTITVNSNAGNIFWSSDPAYGGVFGGSLNGTSNGGSNAQTLRARLYSFTCTGSSGIGTDARPIQVDNFGPDSVVASPDTVVASAGDGGVYIVGWDQGGNDLTVGNITATGPGNIRVVAANSGGHNLFVDGNLTTGSGFIQLYADDDLIFTSNAHIGGLGFSGTVDIRQDRDNANGEFFFMPPGSSIVTSNNSSGQQSPAVIIQGFSAAGSSDAVVATDVKGGGIELSNIQVGTGGSIVVIANANTGTSGQGSIVQQPGTLLDVGGATGSIYLIASAADASGSTNGTAGFSLGNIGYGGPITQLVPLPIITNAGTINATTVGSSLQNTGNINIVATAAAQFFVTTSGNTTASITLTSTAGALTVTSPISTPGGPITLTGAAGVVLTQNIGSASTGAISISGPLSGTGNIVSGSGVVALTQSTSSSYDGIISGTAGVVKAGAGTLTFTKNQTYTGSTSVNGGGFAINGTLATSGTTSITGSSVLGTGGTYSSVSVGGQLSAGTLSTAGILNTGNLVFTTGSALVANLTSAIGGPGTGFDQVRVIGTVDLSSSPALNLIVPLSGVNVGDHFLLLTNDSNDAITGMFASGATVRAFNDARYSFSVNYTAGDGNDIEVVLTNIDSNGLLDVNNGVVSYFAGPGTNNTINVDMDLAGNYIISDTANPITLDSAAIAAGFTVTAGVATGPSSGVQTLSFNLFDGNDKFSLLNAGFANVNVTGTGTLAINGDVNTFNALSIAQFTTVSGTGNLNTGSISIANAAGSPLTLGALNVVTGAVTINANNLVTFSAPLSATGINVTVSGASDIAVSGTGNIVASTLTLGASNSIGTSAKPIPAQTASVVASAGPGGVYINEPSGTSLTATATGAGNIVVVNTAGTLNLTGNVMTATGNINLSSGDGLSVNGNVNAGSGTIALVANADGAGADSFLQNATGSTISTTNPSATAVSITVNTAGGGTGDAQIRAISAPSGTLAVQSYGGNILFAGTDTLTTSETATSPLAPGFTGPTSAGAAPTGSLQCLNYVLANSPTGPGSIGTAARPLNSLAPSGNSETFTAGAGGIYFIDFGQPLNLKGATATGSDVMVVAGNASGHNLVVTGNVSTTNGNIVLAADDDFTVNSGVVIGGAGFSGGVYMAANRDTGNACNFNMNGSIVTSNNSASAVTIEGFHTAGNGTNSGLVSVNNITVGNGGTITISTVPTTAPTGQGSIVAANSSALLNAGPTGTVQFIATTMAGSTAATAAVGTSALPMKVTAGNVIVTALVGTSGTLTSQAAHVWVTDSTAANFTATVGGGVLSNINLTTTSGALTINGATNNSTGGAINLNGAGGIILNADLGNSATGAININGPLSGTGNIITGTAPATVTQATDSTYAGGVSGANGLVKAGAGNLILSGASTFTGATAVNVGTLAVTNSLTGTSAASVTNAGAVLRGTGTIAAAGPVTANVTGTTIWPGMATNGTALSANEVLTINSTVDLTNGKLSAVINRAGGFSQVLSCNSLTLSGSTLDIGFDASATAGIFKVVQTTSDITAPFSTYIAGKPFPNGTIIHYMDTTGATDIATYSTSGTLLSGVYGAGVQSIFVQFPSAGVTPVKLDSFTAQPAPGGVTLSWLAVSEFQNAGYNLYRRPIQEPRPQGSGWTQVNPTLIAGRITNADEHTYSYFDFAAPGRYEYRLESLGLQGEREDYASLAGPVDVDSLDASLDTIDNDTVVSAANSADAVAQSTRVSAVNALVVTGNSAKAASAFAVPALGGTATAATARGTQSTPIPPEGGKTNVAARWFTASPSSSSSFTAAKVTYSQSGVLAIPQNSLPAGYDISRISIQREGRALSALAIQNNVLYVYAPGYSDDYTDKDAIFLRAGRTPTTTGSPTLAQGLFTAPVARTDSPATASVDFHDVYFDFNLRPYTFTPWFSSKYLTDSTDQSFTLNAPNAQSNAGSLIVNLWSLTDGPHTLQVLVNGTPAGQAQWTGGAQMLQLSFQIPASVLLSGSNQIELVTPLSTDGQISLLHSMSLSYTQSLNASQPAQMLNPSLLTGLYEFSNLPGPNAWVVDTRFPDRAALLPYESQLQNDGTYKLRFNAPAGGTGKFIVVPFGQENAPLSIVKRQVKALKLNGIYLATGPAQFSSAVQPLLALRTK